MISLNANSSRRVYIGIFLSVLVISTLLALWRFWPWMPTVFSGDDLNNFIYYKDGTFGASIQQSLILIYGDKYRPVYALTMYTLYHLFDTHLLGYLITNIAFQVISALLVYLIVLRMSHGNWIVSAAIAFAVVTSRFALYQVIQTIGPVESVALIFFLLSFYGVVRAIENTQSAYRWSWFALIAAFLSYHTHEQYIVLVPWLMATLFLIPSLRSLPLKQKIILFSANFSGALFNFLYKITHASFFVGTGGLHLSINSYTIWMFTKQALPSLFGFNHGPDFLAGIDILLLSRFSWELAGIFMLLWLLSVTVGIGYSLKNKTITQWPLLFFLISVLLILPVILNVRVEQRWLIAPFYIILISFAWGITRPRSQLIATVLAILMSLTSITLDSRIAKHFTNFFFIESNRFATLVKQEIIDTNTQQKTPLAFIGGSSYCVWTLYGGEFFRLYEGTPRKVYCFNNIHEFKHASLPENTPLYNIGSMVYYPHLTLITDRMKH